MSGTVTFSSLVHVGARDDSLPPSEWFASDPVAQFEQFSLSTDSVARTGAQTIVGHADLSDRPVQFTVQRRARDTLSSHLAVIAAKDLLNGAPRTTFSGFRDAVARSGYLATVAWSERWNATASRASYSVTGVVLVTNAAVTGLQEQLQVLVWPCDALGWIGTTAWFCTPSALALLRGESGS